MDRRQPAPIEESWRPFGTMEAMAKFTGTVQELGFSIFMQGSHQLVDDKGERIALLGAGSDSVDLNAFLGKKVEVSGSAEDSVEAGATFVSVDSIKAL
jgi:hypothetical protein